MALWGLFSLKRSGSPGESAPNPRPDGRQKFTSSSGWRARRKVNQSKSVGKRYPRTVRAAYTAGRTGGRLEAVVDASQPS